MYFEKKKLARAAAQSSNATSPDEQTVPKFVAGHANDLEREARGADDDDDDDAAAAAFVPQAEPELITIPCGQCKEDIVCTTDLRQMADHLETRHNQRLCPLCSMTFDVSLPDVSREMEDHVDKHFK